MSCRNHLDLLSKSYQRLYHVKNVIMTVETSPQEFRPSDLVWRWYPPAAGKKLGKGWLGPCRIEAKLSTVTYRLKEPNSAIFRVIHVDHLKPQEGRDNQVSTEAGSDEMPLPAFGLSDAPNVDDVDPPSPPRVSTYGRHPRRTIKFAP